MTDRLTDADLDAIERDRLGKPRLGRSIARETDLDLLAIRRLLAEVRRLRAMEQRVRALHHPVPAPTSQHYHCEPYECDRAGEGELRDECGECGRWRPCPTIVALDGGE